MLHGRCWILCPMIKMEVIRFCAEFKKTATFLCSLRFPPPPLPAELLSPSFSDLDLTMNLFDFELPPLNLPH